MNNHASVPVGVLGASGYVGQELLRLLNGHPGAIVAFATAESSAGEWVDGVELIKADDAPWQQAEIILSALPHGVSARYVHEARAGGKRAVDLSADFRLVTRRGVRAHRVHAPARGRRRARRESRMLSHRRAACADSARAARPDRSRARDHHRRRIRRHRRRDAIPNASCCSRKSRKTTAPTRSGTRTGISRS